MNVPGIRKALEQLDRSFMAFQHHGAPHPVTAAVIRVGLRACDEWDGRSRTGVDGEVPTRLLLIAAILREAGVEVEGSG